MVATGNDGHNAPQFPESVGALLMHCHRALEAATLHFGHGTDSAWDEAVALVLGVLGLPANSGDDVLNKRVSAVECAQVLSLLARRAAGEPLPYLLGRAWFAGLEFFCDKRALVPRSPLAELIVSEFSPWWVGDAPQRMLDLCCGGGCIGIAAALYQPQAEVVLADVDEDALALARDNVALHAVSDRVITRRSDLFQDLPAQRFDIILCNPPYVNRQDIDSMPAEFQAEPRRALAAGDDGLDLVLPILAEAPHWLAPGGLLFLELGNSWSALDRLCAGLELTWLEFAHGGHGVLLMSRAQLATGQPRFVELASARGTGSV